MIESDDSLHTRGRALEDAYFQQVDSQLIEKLQAETQLEKKLASLIEATGLDDKELLTHLLNAGIDVGNIAAFSLTPLLFVAWADGSVTVAERQAVVGVALRERVKSNSVAFDLLESWLHERPPRELWEVWKEYASHVSIRFPSVTEQLTEQLVELCTDVAKASGGVLGFGKISEAERRTINEVAAAIAPDA